MLFGTYQRIFDTEKGIPENLINPKRKYNKKLGFSPLWAFPIDDLQSMTAHSICASPNFADIFYLIETDDFIRIDKVKHEKKVLLNEYSGDQEDWDFTEVITDHLDNDHSEIILNPDVIKNENIRFFSPVIDAKKNAMEQVQFIVPQASKEQKEWLSGMVSLWGERVPTLDTAHVESFLLENGYTKEYAKIEGRQRCNKFTFEMTMYPLIYRAYVKREPINGYCMGALCYNARGIMEAGSEYCRWGNEGCRPEDYERIFNKIKKLVLEDEEILKCAAEQKKIYPNEPCPCGSGKKYKRCHGRFC